MAAFGNITKEQRILHFRHSSQTLIPFLPSFNSKHKHAHSHTSYPFPPFFTRSSFFSFLPHLFLLLLHSLSVLQSVSSSRFSSVLLILSPHILSISSSSFPLLYPLSSPSFHPYFFNLLLQSISVRFFLHYFLLSLALLPRSTLIHTHTLSLISLILLLLLLLVLVSP